MAAEMHFTPEQRESWASQTRDSAFNRWLRAKCNRQDGTLDLASLHGLARRYGIDPARYQHLNAGQQRMNIGNRLRSLVPPGEYEAGGPVKLRNPMSSQIDVGIDLGACTAVNLLQLHTASIAELRRRKLVRTGNAPIGDFAEHLFATALGWVLEANSASGHDARDRETGVRYQIKARRLTGATGDRQLSAIRNLPERRFDRLAILLFGPDFAVERAVSIPHALVEEHAVRIEHVNGWRLIATDALLDHASAVDHTDDLRRALAALDSAPGTL